MKTTPGATQIVPSQIDEAGAALGRAFFDDPLQTYMLPDPIERERLSPPVFSALIRYGHLFGETHTTEGRAAAAAVWLPPDETEMTEDRMGQSGILDLPGIVGEDAFNRFGAVLEFLAPFHTRDVLPRHWYLVVLGVDAPLHGQGIGTKLLAPMLARADADGVPCYLETAQPRNVPFYEKQGFQVVVDTVEPVSGLRLWTFRRDPAPR